MVDFNKLNKAFGAAKQLAGKHADKIDEAIDKSVQAADKATKGKYGERLTGGAEKLKATVADVADQPKASGAAPAATPAPDPTPAAPGAAPVVDPDAPKADG